MALTLGCSSPAFVVLEGDLELEETSVMDAPVRSDVLDASIEYVGESSASEVVDGQDAETPVKETATIDTATKDTATEPDTCCGIPCGC